jgi:hypothetical protein
VIIQDEARRIATNIAKLQTLKLAVNPQSNQGKNKETGNNACHNEKRPHQPIEKATLGRKASVHFEGLFVNRRAVLIFDPSRVSLSLLIPNNLKGEIRIIGFGFNDPSAHGSASVDKE